jgi:hypothetical protein
MSISSIGSNVGSGVSASQADVSQTLLSALENQQSLVGMLSQDAGTNNSASDILDLSTAGQTASDQLYQLLSSLEQTSIQASVDKAGTGVQQKLSQALSAAGVDTSQQIDLQVGSDGNVVVSNDNPQKQQIEDTINNNPTLKKAVTQYVQFMQAMAPSLQSNASSQTDGSLLQLLSSLGGTSGSSGASGTMTLSILGNAFQTTDQGADGQSSVLSSSQAQ